jgi:hypothetical protein
MRPLISALTAATLLVSIGRAQPQQRYTRSDGALRVALAQQPFGPNGTSPGPRTMANGGIQNALADLRNATPAVFAQLDRLNRIADKIYVHIDMDGSTRAR